MTHIQEETREALRRLLQPTLPHILTCATELDKKCKRHRFRKQESKRFRIGAQLASFLAANSTHKKYGTSNINKIIAKLLVAIGVVESEHYSDLPDRPATYSSKQRRLGVHPRIYTDLTSEAFQARFPQVSLNQRLMAAFAQNDHTFNTTIREKITRKKIRTYKAYDPGKPLMIFANPEALRSWFDKTRCGECGSLWTVSKVTEVVPGCPTMGFHVPCESGHKEYFPAYTMFEGEPMPTTLLPAGSVVEGKTSYDLNKV
eukprot:Lithocolla_globosa_v1_NODE_4924_length_1338_cov_8.923617.p1 type:complete len:259 gc:universal NODE_4924_length_1338_cov_8.923617:433-1209(+)